MSRILSIVVAPLLAACGPPRLADDGGDSDTGEGSATADMDTAGDGDGDGDGESESTTKPGFDSPPMPDDCDPFAQDCPDGEKCVPYASTGGPWDANKCVPVLGDQGLGEPCTYDGPIEATDDCDGDTMCWDIDIFGKGTCHVFCMGSVDDPECPEMSTCSIAAESVIVLCIPTCDPLIQNCDGEEGCYWTNDNFYCLPMSDGIPTGQPCGYINDCMAGNACVLAEVVPDCAGEGCCANFCDLELGDAQCDVVPGTTCVSFFEDEDDIPPGYEEVGICIAP